MTEPSSDKKADILITALEERYRALHAIRDRVQGVGIWALGLMVTAAGWLVQSAVSLTALQKIFYIIGLLIAIFFLRFKYLDDLRRGFKGQQRVTARLERALGFFTPGAFDDGKDPVYPAQWKDVGTEQGDGKFFRTSYLLIYTGMALLVLAILLNGSNVH